MKPSSFQSLIQEAKAHDSYWIEFAKISFATTLETQKRNAGLTDKDLAKSLGCSAAEISNIFRGDTNVTIETMTKLARATGGHLEVKVAPNQHQPVPATNSTYIERFTDAVRILAGAVPPAPFVAEWLTNTTVNDVDRLQDWIISQPTAPHWVQCIALLDAAHAMASQPEEGCDHNDIGAPDHTGAGQSHPN